MYIIVLSTTLNPHSALISSALRHKGINVINLNADTVSKKPFNIKFTIPNYNKISFDDIQLETKDVLSVFFHHPKFSFSVGEGFDNLDCLLAEASWKNSINWLEDQLGNSLWVNSPSMSRSANSTSLQLSVAQSLGFQVPATCFTNNYLALRDFHQKYHQVVVKAGPIPDIMPNQHRLLTKFIDINALSSEQLKSSPCLFQEYIPKLYELRVHVIGEQVLTCQINSQANTKTSTDWRNYSVADTPHYPYKLDKVSESICIQIVKTLGLCFGIIDLIVTPNQDIVFLECNSQGSWQWIEQLTHLPITNTIADFLCLGKKQMS